MKISSKIYSLIIISFISLTLTSCDRSDKLITRQYQLYNSTSHSVRIDFYHSNVFQTSNQISGSGLIYQADVDDGAGSSLSPENAYWSDSIVVTFDDVKQQIYYFDKYELKAIPDTERNILIDSVYMVVNSGLYQYFFTEEDYLTADSIK